MTISEAKAAYYSEAPIICKHLGHEHEYERISALIYRKLIGQAPYMEVELCDNSGHSVTITTPDRIKLKETSTK